MALRVYPLDTTGSAATNLTETEIHSVSYNADADYHFIIPTYAPFYTRNFQIFRRVGANLIPLTEGMDFHFGLYFETASASTGMPIYGAVVLNRMDESSIYEIRPYQTVGGSWTLDEAKMTELIATIVFNPQSLTWEEVQNKPEIFPAAPHLWSFDDMVGQTDVVQGLISIANAIASKATPGADHAFLKGNVHDLSKYDIGLGNVPDYPLADLQQMISGTNNETLVSPALVYNMLMDLGLADLSDDIIAIRAHMADINNPHKVTKDQVGLGLVENKGAAVASDISRNLDKDVYITLANLKQWFEMHGGTYNLVTRAPIKQGALLNTFCTVNYDRMGTYADGRGGTYDSIIQVKDVTCGYQTTVPIAHPPKGDILNQYCSGPNLMSLVADGFGGAVSTLTEVNSGKCTTGDFKPKGTVLGSTCEGKTLVRTVADGQGGVVIERVENSSQCTANIFPAKGTLLRTKCVGFDLYGEFADGDGGYYDAVEQINSSTCGYIPPTIPPEQTYPPAGTVLGTRCQGYTLYYQYANGAGGMYELIKEQNSTACGYVPPGPGPGPSPSPSPSPQPEDRIGELVWSTSLNSVYIGDTETLRVQLRNWTPNKAYKLRMMQTSVAWGVPYEREMMTMDVRTDSQGNVTWSMQQTENGDTPAGRYTSWIEEVKSKVISNVKERVFTHTPR